MEIDELLIEIYTQFCQLTAADRVPAGRAAIGSRHQNQITLPSTGKKYYAVAYVHIIICMHENTNTYVHIYSYTYTHTYMHRYIHTHTYYFIRIA